MARVLATPEQYEMSTARRDALGLAPLANPFTPAVQPNPVSVTTTVPTTPPPTTAPVTGGTAPVQTAPIPLPKPPAPTTFTPQPVAVTGGTAPVYVAPAPTPTPTRVTGGNAPATTMYPTSAPNPVYNNGAGTVAQPQSPPPPTTVQPTAVTGGTAPVSTVNSAAIITGTATPTPATPVAPTAVTGGNAPVTPFTQAPPVVTTANTAPTNPTVFPTTPAGTPIQAYPTGMDAGSIVQDFTANLLNSGNSYIQNARKRGLETAQTRKLLNSSIAAGASERAAIESAMPLINEMTQIQQDREARAFTGEQNQLDRNQQITMSQVQNWLNNETFNREFNGAISMLPITSSANLMATIQQYALENPEVYTPDVINGFANFFQNNFATLLQDYFPQYYGGGG